MGTSSAMSTSNQYIKYKITVNQNSQSVSNNYSNVTVKVNFYRTNTGYTSYGTGTVYCKINGTTYSASVSSSQKITNSGIDLFSKTLNIYHNNDGTKTLNTSAWISHSVVTSSEQSYSQKLSTIPRASKPTLSASSVTMGNSITIYTNRASSSFTHALYYQIGSGGWNTIDTGIGTSKSWTVPTSFANNTPNSTSLSVKLWLETYNGSTYIGCNSVSFTANVPSGYVPTVNSVTLTEAVSGLSDQFGEFVKGKSKIKCVISASGSYSSTIKGYSSKINGATYTSSSFTTDYLTVSGSCVTTVTDSRGRNSSKTVNYTCTDYSNPAINKFSVSRCNSDGTENDEGAYCKCTIKAVISPVNNKNNKTFIIKYKKLSETEYTTVTISSDDYTLDTTYILADIDTESEYNVVLQVSDYFTTVTQSRNLPTAYTLVDYKANGKGIAFGTVATRDGFDVNMTMYTNDLIYVGYGTDEEKNIRFINLAENQGKTYDTDGVYPHHCKMYGGSQASPVGIGWYDSSSDGDYRILAFNDHEQRLYYGTKGLYSPNTSYGVFFDQYGNIKKYGDTDGGEWGIINSDGTKLFKVNWSDKKTSGCFGSIYQATTLYSNGNGTQSTITFSESVYNYTYLRVYYRSNDWYWGSSIAIPDARIALTSATATSSKTYFKTTVVTLSGTTLTFGNSSECSINTSGAAGMGTSNNIYVLRVIGYK